MSQKCSECGRESQLGQPFQHYWGCVHDTSARTPLLSQTGRMHREYLNGPFNQKANSHGAGDRPNVVTCTECGGNGCMDCGHQGAVTSDGAGVE